MREMYQIFLQGDGKVWATTGFLNGRLYEVWLRGTPPFVWPTRTLTDAEFEPWLFESQQRFEVQITPPFRTTI